MSEKPKLLDLKKFLDSLEGLPHQEQMDRLLENIALIQPKALLEDLLDRGVRNASLYNAATALLKYHKIEVNPLAAAQANHPVGALAHGLPPKDFLDGTEYGMQ